MPKSIATRRYYSFLDSLGDRLERIATDMTGRRKPRARPHILIIENDELTAVLAETYLSDIGYDSETARRPSDAITLLETRAKRYSAVLLDIHLDSSVSGVEIARMLHRRDHPGRHLPVILMTGDPQYYEQTRREDHIYDDVLPKPFNMWMIKQVLETNLR